MRKIGVLLVVMVFVGAIVVQTAMAIGGDFNESRGKPLSRIGKPTPSPKPTKPPTNPGRGNTEVQVGLNTWVR